MRNQALGFISTNKPRMKKTGRGGHIVSTGRRRGAETFRRGLCAGAPRAMKEPPAGRNKISTVIERCQCTLTMVVIGIDGQRTTSADVDGRIGVDAAD